MPVTRVKICGITNIEDAMMAVSCGADALGFVFAGSPREITPPAAREIIDNLPPMIQKIGVFVDTGAGIINDICDFCYLDWVQLHGAEPPEILSELNRPAIKGIRLKGEETLHVVGNYGDFFILVDSYEPGKKGGTGRPANWELAATISSVRPIILAGGLNPHNVRGAIDLVKPYAVDVSSGVESSPGRKDPALVEQFIRKVKES